MIICVEMTWRWFTHTPGNAATIETVARAFPGEPVRVLAEADHLGELRRRLGAVGVAQAEFVEIDVPMHLQGKTHVVSARRFLREFATLRHALAEAPRGEPVLLVLLSATSTAVFAASLLARMTRRPLGVHIGMHGNLNEIEGWRARNPLSRRFDLRSALSAAHPPALRFLVLEPAIRRELARLLPATEGRTDVLPLPTNVAEIDLQAETSLSSPLRFGLIGQATKDKGIDTFLDIARRMTARHGSAVEFYLVGAMRSGDDPARFAPLAHPVDDGALDRARFMERLARLHYVLMPIHPGYYRLSASGAVIDALTWLKPMIATPLPIIADLFARFGDLGTLCADAAAMEAAVEALIVDPDPQRYARQRAALAQARASRTPERLAADYAALVARGFPGLLAPEPSRRVHGLASGTVIS